MNAALNLIAEKTFKLKIPTEIIIPTNISAT